MVKDLDNLLYTLTRANDDLKKGNVSLVGVSNKVNFKERLDARAKSSLCEEELVFQPYDAPQLGGILAQRVPLAFEAGALNESAVNLAAAIAAGENGDARYALNLLLRAGELTEQKNRERVTDREVEEARRLADEDKAFDVIGTLPEHQQLVLFGLANLAQDVSYKRLVEEGGDKYYFSGEVYERYCRAAKTLAKEPRTSRWYREYLHELETLGLITTIESGRGIRGHATLVRLGYEPAKVKRVLEKTLLKP
jgi:cell division control protein 6